MLRQSAFARSMYNLGSLYLDLTKSENDAIFLASRLLAEAQNLYLRWYNIIGLLQASLHTLILKPFIRHILEVTLEAL